MTFTTIDIDDAVEQWAPDSLYDDLATSLLYRKSVDIGGEVGLLELVDAKHPREGGGEDVWLVFRIVKTGQLFELDGYYRSWDGSDWNEGSLFEVQSFVMTVARYKRADGKKGNYGSYV